ncbi:cytochrome C biosynthesis protein [Adhaeribacter swui]|uniref:Cytochrome C biosynthesis protein n=1 Tax=Adhaeribacter swui TaxID=2086471 RepID=A0A7G7G5W6_9BACT|nr:tetratricopeptide repeat protein [Adhaeribacter swui]QNF32550.1 cytochrome C biosynthesis protein [Adhaeribacter swui]
MAQNITKKDHTLDVLENPDVLADRLTHGSEDFVSKYKNVLLGLLGVVAAAIIGGYLFYNYRNTQEKEAQADMFQAIYYFEADSLNKALKGDGQYRGLTTIADEYGSTKAGNLAKFYTGVIYLKQGKFKEAINYLGDYKSNDLILQGKAYSLLGDANLELGNKKEAIDYYLKAADYNSNEFFTPQYLMKAGAAYEANNDFAKATEVYNRIINNYANAAEVADAKKYKARAELLAAGK